MTTDALRKNTYNRIVVPAFNAVFIPDFRNLARMIQVESGVMPNREFLESRVKQFNSAASDAIFEFAQRFDDSATQADVDAEIDKDLVTLVGRKLTPSYRTLQEDISPFSGGVKEASTEMVRRLRSELVQRTKDNLPSLLGVSGVKKDSPMSINYGAIIDTAANRVFSDAVKNPPTGSKQQFFDNLRKLALSDTLAQGGEDSKFSVSWQYCLPSLTTRYAAEISEKEPAPAPTEPVVRVTQAAPKIYTQAKTLYIVVYVPEQNPRIVTMALAWKGRISMDAFKTCGKLGANKFGINNWAYTRVGEFYTDRDLAIFELSTKQNNAPIWIKTANVDPNEFQAALANALPDLSITIVGSADAPLAKFPTFTALGQVPPEAPAPPQMTVPAPPPSMPMPPPPAATPTAPTIAEPVTAKTYKYRGMTFNGARTQPLSEAEAKERVDALERKYVAKLPSGLSAYQREVAMWLLTKSGNGFVEAVAGSGKSTTLLYCAELMADYYGVKGMVSFNSAIAEKNKKDLTDRKTPMYSTTVSAFGRNFIPNNYIKQFDPQAPPYFSPFDKPKYVALEGAYHRYGRALKMDYDQFFYFYENAEVSKKSKNQDQNQRDSYESAIDENSADFSRFKAFLPAVKEFISILIKVAGIARATGCNFNNANSLIETLDYYETDYLLQKVDLPPATKAGESIHFTINQFTAEELSFYVTGYYETSLNYMVNEGACSFEDFEYWPSIGADFCQYTPHSLIFVDEAQDLSVSQINLIERALAANGRVVFVGDRAQAIYGWRGADTRAVSRIIDRFKCDQLALSLCYRCDDEIIKEAKQYVPQIECAPWKKGKGLVKDVSAVDFKKMLEKGEGPKIGDMVLCRLNNPLGGFAAELNAAGTPTIVVGKSDFFSTVRGLIFDLQNESGRNFSLLPKTISDYYNSALRKAINIYKDREIAEKRIQPTTDALAFIASVYKKLNSAEFRKSRVINTFKAFDEFLFNRETGLLRAVGDEGSLEDLRKSRIVCTSIHRAKGDEAARVWWLGPDLEGGSKKNDKPVAPWRIQEELNLKYVATTRAEHELYKVEYVPMTAEDFASAGDFEFSDDE